jgi:hypothetical protein
MRNSPSAVVVPFPAVAVPAQVQLAISRGDVCALLLAIDAAIVELDSAQRSYSIAVLSGFRRHLERAQGRVLARPGSAAPGVRRTYITAPRGDL